MLGYNLWWGYVVAARDNVQNEKKYILALDQGTTSSRAIVFNQKAQKISSAQQEFTQHFPKPGWVEHDSEELFLCQLTVA